MTATILVVDDLLPNVKLLEAKLNSEYYDVLIARGGVEAIKIAKEQNVDIILLDVMMPQMDGFETCKYLKSDPKTAHIPIVMVTALSEVEDRIQGLEAGADDFLTKPINDMALFARIKSLARLKIMLDELRLRDQTGLQFGIEKDLSNNFSAQIDSAAILIVDDDLMQIKYLTNKLQALDKINVEVSSHSELIEKALINNFDLIIISTQLIQADGLRLCSQIRSHEKIRQLPILILVDDDDTKTLIKGLELGVNDYIITPIEGNEVLARVKTQIRRKRYQDALKDNYQAKLNMAMTDKLTGLYNRHYFDVHCKTLLEQAITNRKTLLLLVIDIDFFKSVNDTFGHVVGDEILKQIAERLAINIRLTDSIARFGGEEFIVVMPNTEINSGKDIAERIRLSIQNEPFKISAKEQTLNKTISIGLTKAELNDNVESFLKRADMALYQAKNSGRNQVIII